MPKTICVKVAGLEISQGVAFIRIDNARADLTTFVWPGEEGYEALASLFYSTPVTISASDGEPESEDLLDDNGTAHLRQCS